MPTDRTYPAADGVDTWYAGKSSSVTTADDVVVGVHVGPASAGGVSPASAFDGYTPVERIDSPADGWNDAADYVVYFGKDDADPVELYKATNGDISTLTQLTTGTEYNAFIGHLS
tara:strand:- start:1719 stop:2063 length:345 start_codon:yes stop_codon:yes gene_type:complete